MCHAYSITTTFEAIRQWVGEFERAENIGNLAPQTGVYPDLMAPIIRNQPGFREFVKMRWGMPTSSQALYQAAKKRAQGIIDRGQPMTHEEFLELVRIEPDRGTHNVRNTVSLHWQRWLAPEFRVVVPFTSFAWDEAKKLQRPLPAGMLRVVSVGPKEDPPLPVDEPKLF